MIMDDETYEGKNGDDWNGRNSIGSSAGTQTIILDGNESNFSHVVRGQDVVVVASRASGLNQDSVGSSKVKFKPIVNYDWEQRYYYGNLVVSHVNQLYFAYILKNCVQGKTGGIVRVTNRKTAQSTLLKSFVGKVVDIAFADSERIVLGVVDAVGSLSVFEFFEDKEGKFSEKLILSCTRPASSQTSDFHRLVWCSYIGEEDKNPSDSSGQDNSERIADDSLLLLLTHDEVAELWHVDLINKTSDSVHVNTSDLECGFYVINSHSKAITDAAFSPDATAVATASMDGDVKFFQVNTSDPDPPKCIHYWKPHDGQPISFIHFLDDHKNKNPQAQLWKFVVTGCNENQELKIWDCQNWACIQVISFVAPQDILPTGGNGERGEYDDDGGIACREEVAARHPCIKAKFDLSSSFLVLSDIHRKVIYVLEMALESCDARVSSLSEFLLSHSCLDFDVIDSSVTKKKTVASNGDGFVTEQDWSAFAGENNHDEENDDSGSNSKVSRASASIKLFTVHTRALQELHLKFSSKSSENLKGPSEAAGIASDLRSLHGARDLLSDMGSMQQVLIKSRDSSTPTSLVSPFPLPSQPSPSPSNQSESGFPIERRVSSLSSSTLPQPPFLLAPDAFVSPRDTTRAVLSSSVDYGGDEDEDDDDEVEVRGDVEGADRDRPDGGSRIRSGVAPGNSGGGSHFFDRGGDGAGDGDSSGASTASQEVTEILEGVEDALAGLDVPMDIGQNDDGDVEEDDSHMRSIDPQPTQHSPQSSQFTQPSVIPSHMPFLQQQFQQHNIAHHLPNLHQMTLPLLHHVSTSSNNKMTNINHPSPRLHGMHQSFNHTPLQQSPHNPPLHKWPQAAGIINVDELVRKSEAFGQSNKERRSLDSMTPASAHFIEADELERRFFNSKEATPEVQPFKSSTVAEMMELVKSQNQEIRMINAKIQQQVHVEANMRSVIHQVESLSKDVKNLTAVLDQFKSNSQNNSEGEKLNELFERFSMRMEEKNAELIHLAFSRTKESLNSHLDKLVSNEIKKTVVPKLEQHLESIKEKITSELSHKLTATDSAVKNSVSKLFKSKPILDIVGQAVSTELRGTLRSIHQDVVVPSLDRGFNNTIQQVNNLFSTGTQQYIKQLESHLNQTRQTVENNKHPVIQQIKSTSESLTRSNSQLLTGFQSLQSQMLAVANSQSAAASSGIDAAKLQGILNNHLESVITQVKEVVSDKLAGLLKDHQVAIKDQFDAALRSVTPAPSSSSTSDRHQSIRAQITGLIHKGNYNEAFQVALSASDLNVVEYTCENVDCSVIFGNTCLLSQSVLLSLIQQLAADLRTKTELKSEFLDEAIASLDPTEPVTREHMGKVLEQLCTNLSTFVALKPPGGTSELNKLLRRSTVLLKNHPRGKY